MIPQKVFHQILALGENWRVEAVDYAEKELKVSIRVVETAELWKSQSCPHCRSHSVGGYDHAPERRWRHLNVCQLESEIVCALPRGQCRDGRKDTNILQPMVEMAGTVERHLEGILAHWKAGLTTGFLEGLNSLFSATKRKARGYRSSEYQITMLYFVAGKLPIPCL
jgi:transposase